MSPEATARLRAVRDCGVIRARMGDPGLVELCQDQLVRRRYLPGLQPVLAVQRCDYLLTERGRYVAARLPSGMVFR